MFPMVTADIRKELVRFSWMEIIYIIALHSYLVTIFNHSTLISPNKHINPVIGAIFIMSVTVQEVKYN